MSDDLDKRVTAAELWIAGHEKECQGRQRMFETHAAKNDADHRHINDHLDNLDRSTRDIQLVQQDTKNAVSTGRWIAGAVAGIIAAVILLVTELVIRRVIGGSG